MSIAWNARGSDVNNLPSGWEVRRVGDLVTLVNGYPFPSESFGPSGDIPLVRIRDLGDEPFETYVSGYVPPSVVLRDGDAVIGMDGDFNLALWSKGPAALNQRLCLIRPREGVDIRFIAYALPVHLKIINDLTFSTTVKHLSSSDILSERLLLPSFKEQCRIADFLDTETSQIDRLVSLRTAQRRLLVERSLAYVRSCVTGSEHQSGPSRSISWLGVVPAAWESPILNRVTRFIMGTTFPHEYQGQATGDYPFIKVGDFSLTDELGRLGSADNWISRDVAKKLGARIVPAGAVLYARVGAALLLNRRRITTRPCVIDDNVRAISFTEGDPRYWLNVLSLLDMSQLMNPGPVPSISESQVSAVRIPNPPLAEQSRIADSIEQQQFAMRKVEEGITRQLALLSERRQALITAAVTGQIDVSTASGRGIED